MKAVIATLPGDGVGPEVVAEALKVLHAVALQGGHMAGGQPVHTHPLEPQPFQDAVAALGAVAAAVALLPGRAAIGNLAG